MIFSFKNYLSKMDTEKERCVFLWCVLNTINFPEIEHMIMDIYTDLTSWVSILVNQKSECLYINLCKTSLIELKSLLSIKFMKGNEVEKLYAQYVNIDKNNRRENHLRYGYVLLPNSNNDNYLMEHLRDGYHLSF